MFANFSRISARESQRSLRILSRSTAVAAASPSADQQQRNHEHRRWLLRDKNATHRNATTKRPTTILLHVSYRKQRRMRIGWMLLPGTRQQMKQRQSRTHTCVAWRPRTLPHALLLLRAAAHAETRPRQPRGLSGQPQHLLLPPQHLSMHTRAGYTRVAMTPTVMPLTPTMVATCAMMGVAASVPMTATEFN